MRLLIIACVAVLAVPQATPSQLSQEDRGGAVKCLEDTRQTFAESIKSVADAHGRSRPVRVAGRLPKQRSTSPSAKEVTTSTGYPRE
jgi:hypothetical protein